MKYKQTPSQLGREDRQCAALSSLWTTPDRRCVSQKAHTRTRTLSHHHCTQQEHLFWKNGSGNQQTLKQAVLRNRILRANATSLEESSNGTKRQGAVCLNPGTEHPANPTRSPVCCQHQGACPRTLASHGYGKAYFLK
jgi:hypothetical protein